MFRFCNIVFFDVEILEHGVTMAKSFSKLDQALKDLIEAYGQIEEEYSDKFAEDEESYSAAIMEVLETSIESAIAAAYSLKEFMADDATE